MWYFHANGKTLGPIECKSQITDFIRENPGAWCWKKGMLDWKKAFEVNEVRRMKKDGITPFPPPPESMISLKPTTLPFLNIAKENTDNSLNSSAGFGKPTTTHGIDFRIHGHEMQFIEIELDHGESAIAEAGALMYKQSSIDMETIFGDGRKNEAGILGRLLSAGSRLLTNESLFTTIFTQAKPGKGRVAFASPFPGTITAIKLSDVDGKLICQKDSFLAGSRGVQIGIEFQQKILTGLFGGEGFIMQRLLGDGWVFVHMGGSIKKITLEPGDTLHVDTGCLAAMTGNVGYDIKKAGGIKTMLFGGEGLFFAELKGPTHGKGIVWLQSLPFSRLAGRMLAATPSMQLANSVSNG